MYGPCVDHVKNKLSSKITKNVYPRSYCYYSFFVFWSIRF